MFFFILRQAFTGLTDKMEEQADRLTNEHCIM